MNTNTTPSGADAQQAKPPGIDALQCVIASLRDTAHFSDEEGELTNDLRILRDWALAQVAQDAPVQAAQAVPQGLEDRIEAAIQRIVDNHAPRRIPADPTDVDLVLAEVLAPLDLSVMELAESVGLIGPASRTDDLHEAIQRFHDLIVVNASIKAARHFADSLAQPPLTDAHKAILKKCRNKASRWALEARIPEARVFGEIAQDLEYLCGQLGARHD